MITELRTWNTGLLICSPLMDLGSAVDLTTSAEIDNTQ